jgi:putative Mg2+ transporter-C (MgtC) family protein
MIKFPTDQGLLQLGELGLAFLLSALLGLERELRNKSAGLRTNTLVGVGAALFMLVSKYGFTDVIEPWRVTLDPSRVAAQVASGIGFIGGGLIFVRRDAVCGLTTAAVVWMSAAVGLACGAGLPVLAIAVTVGHFLVVYGFTALNRRLPDSQLVDMPLRLTYLDGGDTLRQALETCTARDFTILEVNVERSVPPCRYPGHDQLDPDGMERALSGRTVSVVLLLRGGGKVGELIAVLDEISGIVAVNIGYVEETTEKVQRPKVRLYSS